MNLSELRAIQNPNLTVPGLYNIDLYNFQKIGVMAILECPRLIVGDKCGMGKTLTALSGALSLHNLGQLSTNDILVVCPGAARDHWKDSCKDYTVLKPLIAETSNDPKKYLKNRFNVLITSFSTMRSHIEELKNYPFKKVVVDEGLFKNDMGDTFQKLFQITKKAPRLLILNANTVENCLMEFYSHVELCFPGLISREEYIERFCATELKWYRTKWGTLKHDIKVTGPKSLEALKELKSFMSNFYLARTPEDAGIADQLPKVVPKIIYVDLKKSQKEAYVEKVKLYKDRKIKPSTVLPSLLRICHGKEKDWKKEEHPEKFSAKADNLISLINSFGNEPFLVYSTFNDPLLACAKIVTNMGKKIGFFTGLQKEEDRQRHLSEFKKGIRQGLFINNAAQRSINIETCRYLICINQLYNPEARTQLESRIRRLSSTHSNVFIYHLIAKNTVEEKILELQDKKEELAKYVNTDGEVPDNLTKDQMERLLGKRKSLIHKDSLKESSDVFKEDLEVV